MSEDYFQIYLFRKLRNSNNHKKIIIKVLLYPKLELIITRCLGIILNLLFPSLVTFRYFVTFTNFLKLMLIFKELLKIIHFKACIIWLAKWNNIKSTSFHRRPLVRHVPLLFSIIQFALFSNCFFPITLSKIKKVLMRYQFMYMYLRFYRKITVIKFRIYIATAAFYISIFHFLLFAFIDCWCLCQFTKLKTNYKLTRYL